MSTDSTTDPRKYARARAGLRRYTDLLAGLDLLVEAEEQAEVLARKNVEARAAVEAAQQQAAAVEKDTAARRAKLNAEIDRDLAEKRGEIERLAAVIATKTDEAQRADERADAAQRNCKKWVEAEARLAPASA